MLEEVLGPAGLEDPMTIVSVAEPELSEGIDHIDTKVNGRAPHTQARSAGIESKYNANGHSQ